MQSRANFRSLSANVGSLATLVVTVLVAAACGTRAGNPKKPGDEPPKPGVIVALPLIDFTVPEDVTTGAELQLLPFGTFASTPSAATAAESFDGGTRRARSIVNSLNSLFAGLNAIEPKLDEAFVHEAAQGQVVGIITKGPAAAAGASYQSTFCFAGAAFLTVGWSADATRIEAVRDLTINPFVTDDEALTIGAPMLGEAVYDATGALPVLESRVDGTLAKGDPLAGEDGAGAEKRAVVDLARIAKVEGGGFVTRALVDFRTPTETEFSPELRTAGSISAAGDRRILAHHNGMPVLCPGAFDETNASNPGWCAGVALDQGEKAHLIPKAERDTLWADFGAAAGVPKTAELRRVTFASGTTCPTVESNP